MKPLKRWTLLIAIAGLLPAAQAQQAPPQPFTISGTVPANYRNDSLIIQYYANNIRHRDTVTLTSGRFRISGKISRPEYGYVMLIRKNKPGQIETVRKFYLEPNGSIVITGRARWDDFLIEGGPIQSDYIEYEKIHKAIVDRYKPSAVANTDDKEEEKRIRQLSAGILKAQNAFIVSHPSSYISWDLIRNRTIVINENPYLLEVLLDAIDPKFHSEAEYATARARVDAVKELRVGMPAPDFVSADTSGKTYKLADFKGKFVFVDFWASWCGFCRAQLPTLKKVFEKYKSDNFTVLAVSYDDSREKWIKAIHEDKMPWLQVSELKGIPESPSSQLYGIRAIPQNILLDPDGIVAARNISMQKFDETVKEVMNKYKKFSANKGESKNNY